MKNSQKKKKNVMMMRTITQQLLQKENISKDGDENQEKRLHKSLRIFLDHLSLLFYGNKKRNQEENLSTKSIRN